MPGTNCPTREELFAYLVGAADEDAAETLIGHAEACRACQTALGTFDDADDTLIAQLRRPAEEHTCLGEPQCREALARAEALADGGRGKAEGGRENADPLVAGGQPMPELPLIGQLGEYRLLEKLGEGGMGVVYKALHTELDRVVALKVLPMGRMADDRASARFRREIKAAGRLEHPNIVHAHDAREIDGTHFLVMEYVNGLDLSELVRRVGPLPVADACELVRQAALGLQCAHEHGLVHRDIKPSNLMLAGNGQVKVLDLGLARIAADQPAGEEMTGTGQAMGTADYMAPEQVSDSHGVDIRADIYSLGCTLYKLLGGHAPFSGPKYNSTFDKMTAHVREPVPSIKELREDVPDELAVVLDRMLGKAPAGRYATPGEVADAVGRFASESDLPVLWAKAEGERKPPISQVTSRGPTDDYDSSAHIGTQPSDAPGPLLTSLPAHHRWKLITVAVGLIFLAFGIIILIKIRVEISTEDEGPRPPGEPRVGAPELPSQLKSAELLVHVETGATVDIHAVTADRTNFPDAVVDGDRVTFEVPHVWYNDIVVSTGTVSGIGPIPKDLRILISISKDGVFDCGAFGPKPGDVLAMFVDVVSDLGPWKRFSFDNSLDFKERPEDIIHPLTCMDLRQNGLACAVAKAYWICATKKHLTGGISTFGQLYDLNWWMYNACGLPITVLKSCLYYNCLDYDRGFPAYLYRLWCPAKKGTSGAEASSFRTFDLSYPDAKATAFVMTAANDNGTTAQVWLDDELLVNEAKRGSCIGRKIRCNVFPKRLKLVIDRPWSAPWAYVVVAQLGGTLEAGNFHENVNGVDNPPDSYDNNPAPMVLHIPEGWSSSAGQDQK